MTPTLTLDVSKFDAALAKYRVTTTKDLAQIVNERTANVIGRAINLTPMVPREKIEKEMGIVAYEFRALKSGKNKGKFRKGAAIYNQSRAVPRAAVILNARRRKAGQPGLEGAEMLKAMTRMISGRKASTGFLKVGWIPAYRAVLRRVPGAFKAAVRLPGVKVVGAAKGFATPAVQGWHPSAIVANSAKTITQHGTSALQRALDQEAAELERHVGAKLGKSAREAGNAG